MQHSLEDRDMRENKIWLSVCLGLIVLPWLYITTRVCGLNGPMATDSCSFASGPVFGTTVLVAVLLALAYCKYKNVKSPYTHAALQLVGIVGLLGVRDAVVTFVYVLSLLIISSYKNKGSKELITSSIYTTVVLLCLFMFMMTSDVFLYGAKTSNALLSWLKSIIPSSNAPALFVAFVTSTLGLIWSNVWTKRHSVFAYVCASFCLLVALFCYVIYSAGQNFKLL